MNPTKVLVIFHCRNGETEKLALAAAVGAVQGRALIRLRRLPDTGETSLESGEDRQRMQKEYVPPTETDALWADGIVFGTNETGASAEYLDLLRRLRSEGKLAGKVGAVICGELEAWIAPLGFIAAPPASGEGVERAAALGRNVADAVRKSKGMG